MMPPTPTVEFTTKRPSVDTAAFGEPCSTSLPITTGWLMLVSTLCRPVRAGSGTTAT